MTVGQRIKQRRLELEMTLEDLGKKLGKNKSTIYRYENGDIENMPIESIKPIADVLKTTPAYLMGWDNQPTEISEKIDVATDILIRMEKDRNFSEVVQILYKLESEKLLAVKTMLESFTK